MYFLHQECYLISTLIKSRCVSLGNIICPGSTGMISALIMDRGTPFEILQIYKMKMESVYFIIFIKKTNGPKNTSYCNFFVLCTFY